MPCLCRHIRQAQSMRCEYCKPLGSPILATWARTPSRLRQVNRAAKTTVEPPCEKKVPGESSTRKIHHLFQSKAPESPRKSCNSCPRTCRARRRRENSASHPPLRRRRVAPLRTTPSSQGLRTAPGILRGGTGAPCPHLAALKVGMGNYYVLNLLN